MTMQTTAQGIYAWRFIAGVGVGVELITIGTYLTELAPERHPSPTTDIAQVRFP